MKRVLAIKKETPCGVTYELPPCVEHHRFVGFGFGDKGAFFVLRKTRPKNCAAAYFDADGFASISVSPAFRAAKE
jgi:hypothetical protein